MTDRGQPVMSKLASTLSGRNRTTSSPGTPLRWPKSPARSAPMYRAAIAVAVRSSSAGSSDSSAWPWTWTNAYGGASRSTHTLTRGSRARARPFAVWLFVLNTRLSSSTMNHTGATSGRPSVARKASLPVRVPYARKSPTRGSPNDATLAADRVAQAEHPPLPPQRRGHHPVPPRRADGRPEPGVLQDLGAGQFVHRQKIGTGGIQRAGEPEPADPPPARHLQQHRDVFLGVPRGQVVLAALGHRHGHGQDHRGGIRVPAYRRPVVADLLVDPAVQGGQPGGDGLVPVTRVRAERLVLRALDDVRAVQLVQGEPRRLQLIQGTVPVGGPDPGHGQPGRAVLVVVPVVEFRLVDGSRVGVDVEQPRGHSAIVCQPPRTSRGPRDGRPPRGPRVPDSVDGCRHRVDSRQVLALDPDRDQRDDQPEQRDPGRDHVPL